MSKVYLITQSEISKSIQLIFEVNSEIGNQFYEMPFVIKLSASSISLKSFSQIVKDEIDRIITSDLAKNYKSKSIKDFNCTLVSQPEVLLISFDRDIDKETLCNSLESSEIIYHSVFNLPPEDKISKRMIPKHLVVWNTKLNIYESFTHQTFRYIEGGRERIESMWTGKYDRVDQQVSDTFFDAVKR